jgi:hypothetical protein
VNIKSTEIMKIVEGVPTRRIIERNSPSNIGNIDGEKGADED